MDERILDLENRLKAIWNACQVMHIDGVLLNMTRKHIMRLADLERPSEWATAKDAAAEMKAKLDQWEGKP